MSILTSSTINATRSICFHHTQHKAAPLTSTQKKKKSAQHEENQAAINMAVDEWFSLTTAKANKLAAHFNKKPHYFLNIFFHGGAHMVHHHGKVNPHNAFMSLKAQELQDGILYNILNKFQLIQLQKGTKHLSSICNMTTMRKYNALGEEEHEELVNEFKENMNGSKHIVCPSPCGHIQDFSNTVHNIIMLVHHLL